MTNPSPPPKTQLQKIQSQANQAIKTVIAHVAANVTGMTDMALIKGETAAELHIYVPNQAVKKINLVGDYSATIGSTKGHSDIRVDNNTVSRLHGLVERDRHHQRHFVVRDQNSANGIYLGKRKMSEIFLRHGDRFFLGPPELAQSVEIRYHNPAPIWVQIIHYGLMGSGGLLILICLILGWQWRKYPLNPLPKGFTQPIAIYAKDSNTPINAINTASHQELRKSSQFSPNLRKALLASEDSRFYWHIGVDPIGIARAVMVAVKKGDVSQGASTVTQQITRSIFSDIGRDKTAGRKLKEMVVALKLETFYSKDEILALYLNRIFLGGGMFGFEDASQFYFTKSAAELDLSESATLVAALQAPNEYNPVKNKKESQKQRNLVIDRMLKLGFINEDEARRAKLTPIDSTLSPKAKKTLSDGGVAPYFSQYVHQELIEILGKDALSLGNLIVETGLDLSMQKTAQKSLQDGVRLNGQAGAFSQGAIVTIDSKSGEIRAMVGGTDYAKSEFNRAYQAQRQPGSTFKVFGYGTAIAEGISPYTTFSCAPLTWDGQVFKKPCERSGGASAINMFQAFAQSENPVALRIAKQVGPENMITFAKKLGIRSPLKASPGLVLGESEVNVLEMTGAYGAIANQGNWNKPHAIRRIIDSTYCTDPLDRKTCSVIYFNANTYEDYHRAKAIAPEVASTLTSLMRGSVTVGTGRPANIGLDEVGKTGTTNSGRDLWFIGFVPSRDLTTGIWLGNDTNATPANPNSSSRYAAALWGRYMKKIVN